MNTFDPSQHPRVPSGQFTDKRRDEPGVGVLVEASEDVLPCSYDARGVTLDDVWSEGRVASLGSVGVDRRVPDVTVEVNLMRRETVVEALDQIADPWATTPGFAPKMTGSEFGDVVARTFPHVSRGTQAKAVIMLSHAAHRCRQFSEAAKAEAGLWQTFKPEHDFLDPAIEDVEMLDAALVTDDDPGEVSPFGRFNQRGQRVDEDQLDQAYADFYETRMSSVIGFLNDAENHNAALAAS